MLIPIYVHKDQESSFGVTIPDIPGCFTAGDTLEEAVRNVQEAVELHLEGEEMEIEPSRIENLVENPDYQGGVWIMVDVDFSFLKPRFKRINVTVPEHVLARIDEFARSHDISRSAFLVEAAKQALGRSPVS